MEVYGHHMWCVPVVGKLLTRERPLRRLGEGDAPVPRP